MSPVKETESGSLQPARSRALKSGWVLASSMTPVTLLDLAFQSIIQRFLPLQIFATLKYLLHCHKVSYQLNLINRLQLVEIQSRDELSSNVYYSLLLKMVKVRVGKRGCIQV